jgi:hypothetical protein
MHYFQDNPPAHPQIALNVSERVRFAGDNRWWTVKAVTANFAALTRQAEFEPKGVLCYTVVDWRNGVRGPCDLIGQAWGDGSYSEEQCGEMLAEFEAADEPDPPADADGTWPARNVLHVSQRNWVRIEFTEAPAVAA